MAYAATKERAHELIDRMVPEQVPFAVDALEKMIDPVAYSLANAPFEDEEISEEEEEAVARAKAETGPGTSMEDLMVELGFSAEDIERVGQADLPSGGTPR
jgi:hypothetical protein